MHAEPPKFQIVGPPAELPDTAIEVLAIMLLDLVDWQEPETVKEAPAEP